MYLKGLFSRGSWRTVTGSSGVSCGLRTVGGISGTQAETCILFPLPFMAMELRLARGRLVIP